MASRALPLVAFEHLRYCRTLASLAEALKSPRHMYLAGVGLMFPEFTGWYGNMAAIW